MGGKSKSDATKLKDTRKELKDAKAAMERMQAELDAAKGMNAGQNPSVAIADPSRLQNFPPQLHDQGLQHVAAAAFGATATTNGALPVLATGANPGVPAQNAFSQASMQAYAAKKKKKSTKKEDEFMTIKEKIRLKVWRKGKFASTPKRGRQFAILCLDALELQGYEGDTPESKEARRVWVETFMELCVKALNEVRQYVQSQLRRAYTSQGVNNMPSLPDMIRCLKREIDFTFTVDENGAKVWNNKDDVDLFCRYWTEILPQATANGHDWDDGKKYYMTISGAHAPNDPNHFYITPSTEAFAVLALEGNRYRWEAIQAVMDECKGYKHYQDAVYDLDGKQVTDKTVSLVALGPNSRNSAHQSMPC